MFIHIINTFSNMADYYPLRKDAPTGSFLLPFLKRGKKRNRRSKPISKRTEGDDVVHQRLKEK